MQRRRCAPRPRHRPPGAPAPVAGDSARPWAKASRWQPDPRRATAAAGCRPTSPPLHSPAPHRPPRRRGHRQRRPRWRRRHVDGDGTRGPRHPSADARRLNPHHEARGRRIRRLSAHAARWALPTCPTSPPCARARGGACRRPSLLRASRAMHRSCCASSQAPCGIRPPIIGCEASAEAHG